MGQTPNRRRKKRIPGEDAAIQCSQSIDYLWRVIQSGYLTDAEREQIIQARDLLYRVHGRACASWVKESHTEREAP